MNKTFLSVLLATVVAVTAVAGLLGCSSGNNNAHYTRVDENGNENSAGGYILFGSYPQSNITDEIVLAVLNNSAGTLPDSSNDHGWTDYCYYIEDGITPYMWYKDLEYNDEKYRGVYFISYRPWYTAANSSADASYQDENGYFLNAVYWFKYEPIKWRILSEQNGVAMLLAEMILDSQEYYNFASSGVTHSRTAVENYDDAYYAGNDSTVSDAVYDNNYLYSNVRKWLNETFYTTAFSDLQKAIIATTIVDNSASSTSDDENATDANIFACANTNDKVFLLSQNEATSAVFGFGGYLAYDEKKQKKPTDYAQCQGADTNESAPYSGCGWWWLRSSYAYYNSHFVRNVDYGGDSVLSSAVNDTIGGIVPALNIKL